MCLKGKWLNILTILYTVTQKTFQVQDDEMLCVTMTLSAWEGQRMVLLDTVQMFRLRFLSASSRHNVMLILVVIQSEGCIWNGAGCDSYEIKLRQLRLCKWNISFSILKKWNAHLNVEIPLKDAYCLMNSIIIEMEVRTMLSLPGSLLYTWTFYNCDLR